MQLDIPNAQGVATAIRNRVGDYWNNVWLFFRLTDMAVRSILVVERDEKSELQYVFSGGEIGDALRELHEQSRKTASKIKSGTAVLKRTGEFEIEYGYDDTFGEDVRTYNERIRKKYFPGRTVLPAEFDPD